MNSQIPDYFTDKPSNAMKAYSLTLTLLGSLLIMQSAYAQEYDDLYFSSKDRIKLKAKRGDLTKPDDVSSKFYYTEPVTASAETTPEAVATSKFSNPDFQAAPNTTAVEDESEFAYYEAPEATPFTMANPRPGDNIYNNVNQWDASNQFNNWGTSAAFAGWGNPYFNNFGVNPFFGGMNPYWDAWAPMPMNQFGVSVGFGFGWGNYWGFSAYDRWRFRNRLFWGNGFPMNRFGWGWNSWGNPWCSPFMNNVVVVNNRFIGGERFVRNVYRGPIGRRSSVGTTPNLPGRSVQRTVNNPRAAMNRRYAEALNNRRSTPSNERTGTIQRPTRRSSTPATVTNPNRYRRSSTPSYNSRGSSSPSRSIQRPTRSSSSSPSYNRRSSSGSRFNSGSRGSSGSRSSSGSRGSSGSRSSSGRRG